MTADRKEVLKTVVAAVCDVLGSGAPPTDEAAVEEYLKTEIRVVLGPGSPADERKRVAKLVAKRTNDLLQPVLGDKARVAKADWLTKCEDKPLSHYAGMVATALANLPG